MEILHTSARAGFAAGRAARGAVRVLSTTRAEAIYIVVELMNRSEKRGTMREWVFKSFRLCFVVG